MIKDFDNGRIILESKIKECIFAKQIGLNFEKQIPFLSNLSL